MVCLRQSAFSQTSALAWPVVRLALLARRSLLEAFWKPSLTRHRLGPAQIESQVPHPCSPSTMARKVPTPQQTGRAGVDQGPGRHEAHPPLGCHAKKTTRVSTLHTEYHRNGIHALAIGNSTVSNQVAGLSIINSRGRHASGPSTRPSSAEP